MGEGIGSKRRGEKREERREKREERKKCKIVTTS